MRFFTRPKTFNIWIGSVLLAAATLFFLLVLWPRWKPDLAIFWSENSGRTNWWLMGASIVLSAVSQVFAPRAWVRLLRALDSARAETGDIERNWYTTQMGSYIPGKIWMYIGRMAFLGAGGVHPAVVCAAVALENIYLMAGVCIVALVALPFTGPVFLPAAVQAAMAVSVAAMLTMLCVPGIQALIYTRLTRRLDRRRAPLPRISARDQAVCVAWDSAGWILKSLSLLCWVAGVGLADHPLRLAAACMVAIPVSWLAAIVLVFVPGGFGVRESVQGLLLAGFAGSVGVATTIALAHRVMLTATEGLFASGSALVNALERRKPLQIRQVRHAITLGTRMVQAALARLGLAPAPIPVNLTFSVTRRCQSRCRTCLIWEAPKLEELTLEEIGELFRDMGWVYFFNVSGGEPFLRSDLPGIIELACRHLHPAVIHIPTNALLPERIEAATLEILDAIDREAPGTVLTIKPSFDGVGSLHDEIRGVPGNFEKLLDTIGRLERIRASRPNLHVGVGTVVSRFNAGGLEAVIEYAKGLGVDTYINEIAEEREEFFNAGTGITPDPEAYRAAMRSFKAAAVARMKDMRLLGRITSGLRLVYYDLVVDILCRRRQVIPCYAGILNVHVNADGGVWPCAIRAYAAEMGRFPADGGFRRIWRSARAAEIRRSIRRGECYCPLANQAYSNMLMHPPSLARALARALGTGRRRRAGRTDCADEGGACSP
jgi:MoaA/NifB/PqqE/SkfB family radical SAM enzyme/uncharacterized membrane protein YbhN (UPF0104 family)